MNSGKELSLIYIVGRGHSGSTLLDLLLGKHSRITSLGELKWLSYHKRHRADVLRERCTCGASSLSSCKFWQDIAVSLRQDHKLSLEELDLRASDPLVFERHNLALLDSVRRKTGHSYFVDSSKNHKRLEQLMTLQGSLTIYPIYIVRNPCGVVYSHLKQGRSLKHWAKKYKTQTREIHKFLHGHRYHLVEYERLSTAPRETLREVMGYLGLGMEEDQYTVSRSIHHNIGGNPMRHKKSIEIVPDESWRDALNIRQKLAVYWYTGLMRRDQVRLRKLSR